MIYNYKLLCHSECQLRGVHYEIRLRITLHLVCTHQWHSFVDIIDAIQLNSIVRPQRCRIFNRSFAHWLCPILFATNTIHCSLVVISASANDVRVLAAFSAYGGKFTKKTKSSICRTVPPIVGYYWNCDVVVVVAIHLGNTRYALANATSMQHRVHSLTLALVLCLAVPAAIPFLPTFDRYR